MSKSKIEWTDVTWNPVVGCTRVSEGCRNCYAERMSSRLANMGKASYSDVVQRDQRGMALPRWNNTIKCLEDRLDEPLRWKWSVSHLRRGRYTAWN